MNSVSELNKEKIRLFVDAVWNEGRLELIDELVADDYVGRAPCVATALFGPQAVRGFVSTSLQNHPNLYVKIEDQVAEDDRVATRWLATAVAPGSPTDRTPLYAGISVIRLLAGKQVDSHTQYTTLAQRESETGPPRDRPGHR